MGLEREVPSAEMVGSLLLLLGIKVRRSRERVMVVIFWAVLDGKSISW